MAVRRPRRPNRKGSFAGIGSVLDSSLSHLNLGARLREFRLRKLWPGCVGEAIARRAAPDRLLGSTLFCAVESPPWMTELNYQKSAIIEKINAAVGAGAVTEIVFRTGRLKRRVRPPETPQRQPRPLTPEEEMLIRRTASAIRDERLRGLVERVMRKARS